MTLVDRTSPRGARRGSFWLAALVMLVLALVLGWIPILGPLVAGVAGGTQARSVGTALAAVLPGIVVALLILVIGTAVALPIIGALAGLGAFLIMAIVGLPLLIGAAIGGWMSAPRNRRAA